MWGSSPDDVWAVGDSAGDVWAVGQSSFLHWDGSALSAVGDQIGTLNGVWGDSSNHVWAVGDHVSLRWNGTTWLRSDPIPANLNAAWGSAADDIWAVGESGSLAHWDGDNWSISCGPISSVSVAQADWCSRTAGIAGTSGDDVWATTETADLLHWDGRGCSTFPSGSTTILRGLWGSAAADMWAVGDRGAIVHWDGRQWSASPSPTKSDLFVVASAATNDVWAAGTQGTVLHWDGTAWSVSSLPATGGWNWWDGAEWSPSWANTSDITWTAARAMATGDVWIVGEWVGSDRTGWGAGPALIHWNGTEWSNSPQPFAGFGMWSERPDDLWLVGTSLEGGYHTPLAQDIAHWNGTTWVESFAGGSVHLCGVWGSSSADIWSVGGQGIVLRKR